MSRFYSALWEASRDEAGIEPAPAPVLAPVNGLRPPPFTVPVPDEVPPVAGATLLANPESPHSNRLQVDFLPAAAAPVSRLEFGTRARVLVDSSARIIPHAADPQVVEYYRRLRTKILQHCEAKPFKTLVVTSPGPQEGKTVTVMNLGLSLAMIPDFKVLVIDGDLRRGSLGKWLGADDQPGLSDLIGGSATLEEVVLKGDEIAVSFMVRGKAQIPAGELLHSPDLASHIRRAAEHFDMVLIDSPPVNIISDVHLLASGADALLLVARAFSTTRKAFERAAQDLERFRVLGAVFNGGTRAQRYGRYNGYY